MAIGAPIDGARTFVSACCSTEDVMIQAGDPAVDRALEELGFHSKWVRVLGTYRRARARG